ncbi:MAG TPA: nuclear transport factor 2 family protein [Rhizomicrobium sp.]|nr:nuclear transport factor 2 family protein [Rhizomicrobium sp.]
MRLLIRALAFSSIALSIAAEAQESRSPAPADARQQVMNVTEEWIAAENKHDTAALGRLLDDKFISTFAANRPRGKDAFIKGIVAGPIDPTQSQSLTDVSVVIDGDTAVTVGTDTFHSATKPPLALRYTITYVHKQGRWVALGEHIVTIPSTK